jgi:hypothetical protein
MEHWWSDYKQWETEPLGEQRYSMHYLDFSGEKCGAASLVSRGGDCCKYHFKKLNRSVPKIETCFVRHAK